VARHVSAGSAGWHPIRHGEPYQGEGRPERNNRMKHHPRKARRSLRLADQSCASKSSRSYGPSPGKRPPPGPQNLSLSFGQQFEPRQCVGVWLLKAGTMDVRPARLDRDQMRVRLQRRLRGQPQLSRFGRTFCVSAFGSILLPRGKYLQTDRIRTWPCIVHVFCAQPSCTESFHTT